MKTQIILISGKMGSGKTTLAEALCAHLNKKENEMAQHLTFAEPLYRMHDHVRQVLSDLGFNHPDKKDRELLQFLGTNWARAKYGEDIWVEVLKKTIKFETLRQEGFYDKAYFIVSDCRFENEFNAFEALKIRLYCGEKTRMLRRLKTDSPSETELQKWNLSQNHPSELGLDHYAEEFRKFDFYTDTEIFSPEEIINFLVHQGRLL